MTTLMALGLANAACAALLAIPAWMVSRRGRRPALAHALWILVLLKLVTPPFIRPNLGWLREEPTKVTSEQPEHAFALADEAEQKAIPTKLVMSPIAAPPRPMVFRQVHTYSSSTVLDSQPKKPTRALLLSVPRTTKLQLAKAPAPPDGWSGLADLLMIVWLTGSILCLGRSLFYVVRFHGLLAHGRAASHELQEQAETLARSMGMKRAPLVWLIPGALPPMIWGVVRVRLLFPQGLLARLSEQERASLLTHELAHVYRRDHWVRLLELIALTLFWWFPLTWWAKRQLQAREEECCDAWAAGEVPPRVYATAILEAVDFLAERRPLVPAMASALESKRSLKERLTLILTQPSPRRLSIPSRVAIVVLGMIVLPMVPNLSRADKPNESAKTADPEPITFVLSGNDLFASLSETFSVQFSPDGKSLAAGSGRPQQSGQVELFDVLTRKSVWQTTTPRGVASVVFSPDSKMLTWSGYNDVIGGMNVLRRRGSFDLLFPGGGTRLATSSDGKWLAAATEEGKLQLLRPHHAEAPSLLDTLGADENLKYFCVAFSPDSAYLAAGGGFIQAGHDKDNRAVIWDVKSKTRVARLEGHTRAVLNVAFAPKNRLIATASADNTVRIWDGKDYKLRLTLTGHTRAVKGLAFSPDGKQLATGSWDGSIRLWDPEGGKLLNQLRGEQGIVREIAYSPDGKLLASGGGRRTVKLWDPRAGKEVATLRRQKSGGDLAGVSMTASPDGKLLAVGGEDGRVHLLNPLSGDVLRTIQAHEDAVTTLAFSPDGRMLSTSGPDTVVKVWSVDNGKLVQRLQGHGSWVYSLAFSHDGKRLASGSYDCTIRLWSLNDGKSVELEGHRASVRALAFSEDDKLLASGSEDRSIRVWDLVTLQRKALLKDHEGGVRGLALVEKGKALISAGGDGLLKRWDLASGKPVKSVRATPEGQIVSMAVSPGQSSLVLGTENGSVLIYNPRDLSRRPTPPAAHRGAVVATSFGAAGKQFFTLGSDRTLKVWQGQAPPLLTMVGHKGPVRHAVYSPDGTRILSAGGWPEGDRALRLWDAQSGKAIRTVTTRPGQIFALAWCPDGRQAILGLGDGSIEKWDVDQSRRIQKFTGHTSEVPYLSISEDGKHLLTASHDKTVKLWNLENGAIEKTFTGHDAPVRAVLFHPDGKRIISGSWDKTVRTWDRASGKQLRQMLYGSSKVERLALLPDAKRVLVVGESTPRIYNLTNGQMLQEIGSTPSGSTGVDLSADGKLAVVCGYGGAAQLWDVESGKLLQQFVDSRSTVWSARFSPDGTRVLTAGGGTWVNGKPVPGDDFALRIWRLPTLN